MPLKFTRELIEALLGEVGEPVRAGADAGVVECAVESPVARQCLVDQRSGVGGRADVAVTVLDVGAVAAQLLRELGQTVIRARAEHQGRTLATDQARGRGADTSAGADDRYHLAGQQPVGEARLGSGWVSHCRLLIVSVVKSASINVFGGAVHGCSSASSEAG